MLDTDRRYDSSCHLTLCLFQSLSRGANVIRPYGSLSFAFVSCWIMAGRSQAVFARIPSG